MHFGRGQRLFVLDGLNHDSVSHRWKIRALWMVLFLETGLLVDLDVDSRSFLGFDFKMFLIDGDDGAQNMLARSVGEGR